MTNKHNYNHFLLNISFHFLRYAPMYNTYSDITKKKKLRNGETFILNRKNAKLSIIEKSLKI